MEDCLKEVNMTPTFKKEDPLDRITDLSKYYHYFQKYIKGLFIISFQFILKDS